MALRKIQTDMVSHLADLDFNTATLYSNLSVYGEIRTDNIRWITGANIEAASITTLNHLNVSGNATIAGNLSALGNITYIDTNVVVTSAMSITNTGTGPALVVDQTGAQPIADFRDDGVSSLFIADGGNVGIRNNSPQAALHVTGDTTISGNISSFGIGVDYLQGSILLRRTNQQNDGIRIIPQNVGSTGRIYNITNTVLSNDRTLTLADADTTLTQGTMAARDQNNTFTGANTFINTSGQTFRQTSTQDGITILGGSAGTGTGITGTITPQSFFTINRTFYLPDLTGVLATIDNGQIFTAAQTFRAANAIRVEAAATQDAIILAGRAGGTSLNAVTLTPSTLTTNRTLTLPDATGTIATINNAQIFTAQQTFRASNSVRVDNGATADAIILAGGSNTNSRAVTITPTSLGANRTLTLPDASGTVATTEYVFTQMLIFS